MKPFKSIQLMWVLVLVFLSACQNAHIREESVWRDRDGQLHRCGIGEGLAPCTDEEGNAITNEDLDQSADEINQHEKENFEETVRELEAERAHDHHGE